MAYKFDSRSAESYKKQLMKIQEEISELIESMENGEEETCEVDNDNGTYKTSEYNNSLHLKRKIKHHNSRSANIHQLDGNNTIIREHPKE